MAGLTTTLAALARYRQALAEPNVGADLREIGDLADNPAGLRGFAFVPETLAPGAGLVVALHGCAETACQFDLACGWSALARRHGFAVLLPEQVVGNNPAGCFNWFRADQQSPAGTEARSVVAMVDAMVTRHRVDPRRVYACGLSAGGAMAAALLCMYPMRFAAGAILAGMPFAQAHTLAEGTRLMAHGTDLPAGALAEAARRAAGVAGPWPPVQIWQGLLDTVVAPANAEALTRQFLGLNGLPEAPGAVTVTPAARWEIWRDRSGREVVTKILLPLLGHAVPLSLAAPDPDQQAGRAGPFAQEAGLAASWHIARAFGLVAARAAPRRAGAHSGWKWPFGHGSD